MVPEGRITRRNPEAELLRLCARTALTPAQSSLLHEVVGDVRDWDVLLRRAAFHGLLPLLAKHLDGMLSGDIPPTVLQRAREELRRITRRNLALTAELLALLAGLEARGVLAIPYKGPVLAASVYGHVGLRDFSDLDILVRRDDVVTAKAVLLQRGYRPQYDLSSAQEAALIDTRYEHPFERPGDGVVVEVQWAIVPRYFSLPLNYEDLWLRRKEVPLGGRMVPSLSPEDLLLVLIAHGGKHLWRRIGWVCDIAQLLRSRSGLDWGAVHAEADRVGAGRLLHLGLRLARDPLGTPLPPEVAALVDADAIAARLAAQVQEGWWARPETWPGIWESMCFHLRARERWQDRLRYCVGVSTTTTPGDWTVLTLPRCLFPLYYPLRAIRLAVKYGGMARRRLVTGRGPA